tara:strand:- start:1751 stop:2830 length:1080 start_codon:yes stop_codon:yes gene_type:complete
MISRSKLRNFLISEVRSIVEEKSKLQDFLYKPLEKSIEDSMFWLYPNTEYDADMENVGGQWQNQSQAAQVLGSSIEAFMRQNGYPIKIIVISVESDSNIKLDLPVEPGHILYPNSIVVGGEQSVGDRGEFVMILYLVPVGDDFNPEDVDSKDIAKKIGKIVRHELIHADQFEKRRVRQKISRLAAKDRFSQEGEIVDSDDRLGYLSSNMEIDAYAHEFAEELLYKYGKDESLSILRGGRSFENLDISDQFKEYMSDSSGLSRDKINRLKNKMYSNIIDLTDREIYSEKKERKKKKKKKSYAGHHPDESYEKGTVKNLYLDQPSTHGGWPEGPSKSFTSDEPVMKQISGFLKNMKLLESE